jgi:hypothetical protein
MGGFTKIQLRDTSRENIDAQNARLELAGVPKKYRFYSEADVIFEYESFKQYDGVFPEQQFPREKIRSLEDFKRYWSAEALGEIFVPPIGALIFDCYFGRTSQRAMQGIARYVAENHREIEKVGGSFETFVERGANKLQTEIIKDSAIYESY